MMKQSDAMAHNVYENYDHTNLDVLPDSIMVKILRLLNLTDFTRLSLACRQFNALCADEQFWKRFCREHWLLDSKFEASALWKDCFGQMYKEWGRYVYVYAKMKAIWNDIFRFTATAAPAVRESFLRGLTDDELDQIEHQLQLHLPLDLRCSYRMCNGQRMCPNSVGLFGSYNSEYNDGDFLVPFKMNYHGPRTLTAALPGCVPIIDSRYGHSTILLCIQDNDEHLLKLGWVFSVARSESQKMSIFVFGETGFADYFAAWARNLPACVIHDDMLLKYTPNSHSQTGPFTVETETCFVREGSTIEPDRFSFHYRITLRMDATASRLDSCQLETRHWTITDEQGHTEHVDGEGVVGAYPVMEPGASFTWISGTNYRTKRGSMGGHFMMRNLYTSLPVRIECATFKMEAPKILTYRQREELAAASST